MDYSQIRIKYIPAIFPNYSFEDRRYVETEVIKNPENQINLIKTDRALKTLWKNSVSRQLLIQSQVYDRYTIELTIRESQDVGYIRAAGLIDVVTTEGDIISAELLSLDFQRIEKTYFYTAVLDFYELKDDINAISNYLSSDYVLATNPTYTIRLRFSNSKTFDETDFYNSAVYDLHTIIVQENMEEDGENEAINVNGYQIPVRSLSYKYFNLVFYLSETQVQKLKSYAKRCFYPTSSTNSTFAGQALTIGGTTYIACRPIDYEIEQKELIGLWECRIKFYYSIINYYHFA